MKANSVGLVSMWQRWISASSILHDRHSSGVAPDIMLAPEEVVVLC